MNAINNPERTYRVLVTGVGAIIGYGVIRSLRASGLQVYVIGMDIYGDAVGQQWCDEFIQAKYAVDPHYIDFLSEIIEDKKIDLVFFGTEQEIKRVDNSRDELGSICHKLVLNKHELIQLSADKWLTYQYLINSELAELAIPSVIEGTYGSISDSFGKEFLIKPRCSYAGKGIVRVAGEEQFEFYKDASHGFMAQKLIGDNDHEYTVGIFGLGDGTYSGYIALRRQLSQEGATAKAWTVNDALLAEWTDELCHSMKPLGPTNFQFRSDGGRFYLLEVNPRISSSTSIRARFGYNEAALCLNYFINHEISYPTIRTGSAFRYIDDCIVYE